MNCVQYSSEDRVTKFPAWENLPPYLKLEEEEDSEAADEMERLKNRQRQREDKEQKKCSKEMTEEPVLA